jgi:hypothetical protein
MPDGALIVVAMDTLTLLRRAPGESYLTRLADLSQVCSAVSGQLNDLVIDPRGQATLRQAACTFPTAWS